MSESEDVKNKKGGGDQIKPTEITLETWNIKITFISDQNEPFLWIHHFF
jgi:hypothetical protein